MVHGVKVVSLNVPRHSGAGGWNKTGQIVGFTDGGNSSDKC